VLGRVVGTTLGAVAVLLATAWGAAGTQVVSFSPFAADGALRAGVKIAPRSGKCWTTASAPVVQRAYRCMAGNLIHDPCFEPPGGVDAAAPAVVCVAAPWERTVIRLHLQSKPDFETSGNPHPTLPWAMRLAGGRRCTFQQGASGLDRAGRRLNYNCAMPGGGRELWLFGSVRRSRAAAWRIRAGQPATGFGGSYALAEHWVTVRTAWR
jgi:hypothetical protein